MKMLPMNQKYLNHHFQVDVGIIMEITAVVGILTISSGSLLLVCLYTLATTAGFLLMQRHKRRADSGPM